MSRIQEIGKFWETNGLDKTLIMFPQLSKKTVKRYICQYKADNGCAAGRPVPPDNEKESLTQTENSLSFQYEGSEIIDTVDKAVAKSRVDLSVWEVDSFQFSTWTVTIKDNDGFPQQKNNYRVLLKFKKKKVDSSESIKQIVVDAFKSGGIEKFKLGVPNLPKGELMLELDVFDAHIGKLAWSDETGEDYDLKIAKNRYTKNVAALLERSLKFGKLDEIVFPVGNDFFHYDNTVYTTTAGTRQDSDSRWQKIWKEGVSLTLDTINFLSRHCRKLRVVTIPGNHDTMMSQMLGTVIEHVYSDCPNIEVNNSSKVRKLITFGSNAIMFSHGDKGKLSEYPLIMMREFTKEIVNCSNLEIHLGHFHKNKNISFLSEDESQGITVRFLRSISGTDAWHYQNGYTNSKKGGEAFLYHKQDGMICNLKGIK